MRTLLLVPLFAATLCAQSAFYQPADWSLGTELPSVPQQSTRAQDLPSGRLMESQALAKSGEESFAILRVLFPLLLPPDQYDSLYENGKKSLLRDPDRQLISEEKISICGHPGRRYVFARANGTRYSDYRSVMFGGELFQFIYDRPAHDPNSPAAAAFFSNIKEKKKVY